MSRTKRRANVKDQSKEEAKEKKKTKKAAKSKTKKKKAAVAAKPVLPPLSELLFSVPIVEEGEQKSDIVDRFTHGNVKLQLSKDAQAHLNPGSEVLNEETMSQLLTTHKKVKTMVEQILYMMANDDVQFPVNSEFKITDVKGTRRKRGPIKARFSVPENEYGASHWQAEIKQDGEHYVLSVDVEQAV